MTVRRYVPLPRTIFRFFAKLFRMWPAWVISIALLVGIYYISPAQIGVTAAKALSITMGAVLGFWAHVWCFGHIDDLAITTQETERNRRAFLMGMGMVAFALAV